MSPNWTLGLHGECLRAHVHVRDILRKLAHHEGELSEREDCNRGGSVRWIFCGWHLSILLCVSSLPTLTLCVSLILSGAILWTACSMDTHMRHENSHLALRPPCLLWQPCEEKTGNCCQRRLWGSTYRRFGRGGRELCSQAVIQSDKAQRWNGRAEGNRSNGVLTNEES